MWKSMKGVREAQLQRSEGQTGVLDIPHATPESRAASEVHFKRDGVSMLHGSLAAGS